jgi:hypothetical protein
MKKSLGLLVVAFFLAQGLWAQFYTTLPREERKALAEDYYLVGEQYEKDGQAQKGKEFKEMAFNIDPQLNPAQIQQQTLPSAAALILEGKARLAEVPPERAEAIRAVLSSRFLRLASAFLSKDTAGMLSLMDGSLYLADLNAELTQAQIASQLDAFFASTDLGGLAPSDIFELSSLTVMQVPAAQTGRWGEVYALRIRSKKDFSKQIAFWTQQQQYLYRRVGNQWLLFSVGQKLPPSTWTPKPVPTKVAGARMSPALAVDPTPTIEAAFLACINDFLRKDVTKATQYFANEVLIIRLDATLTRQEIADTFEGYFESSDFTGLTAKDILYPDSVYVVRTDRFSDMVTGPEYLLGARSRLELSQQVEFWTRFSDFYFTQENGAWRIFAIF